MIDANDQQNDTERVLTAPPQELLTALRVNGDLDFLEHLREHSEHRKIPGELITTYLQEISHLEQPGKLRLAGILVEEPLRLDCKGPISLVFERCIFHGSLDLFEIDDLTNLKCTDCEFGKKFGLDRCTISKGINITRCNFNDWAEVSHCHIARSVWIVGCTSKHRIQIFDCSIDGDLYISGSDPISGYPEEAISSITEITVGKCIVRGEIGISHISAEAFYVGESNSGKFWLHSSSADSYHLLKNHCSGEVSLLFVTVRRYMSISDCEVRGPFSVRLSFSPDSPEQYLTISSSSFIRDAHFSITQSVKPASLSLDRLKCGGDLELMNAGCLSVRSEGMSIVGNVDLYLGRVPSSLNWARIQVGGHLALRSGRLTGFELLNGSVDGSLRMGYAARDGIAWNDDACLCLAGTTVGFLDEAVLTPNHDDREEEADPWPRQMDLRGFSVKKVELTPRVTSEQLAGHIIKLLRRDISGFGQPFFHFADKFEEIGEIATARRLRFEGKERQRTTSDPLRAIGLGMQKVLIGYGIGLGYWLILPWVIGVTILGAIVLYLDQGLTGHWIKADQTDSWTWMFAASLDALLPFVTLDKSFGEIVPDQLSTMAAQLYFWCHTLVGWFFGAILGAGLAGLTQKS